MPDDCTFASFLEMSAPLITDQLVEVRLCSTALFSDTVLVIDVREGLHEKGALASLLQTPGVPSFYVFTVQEERLPEPVQPPLVRSFFDAFRNGPVNEPLSLPERRVENCRVSCIDQTYNYLLDVWAADGLGFNASDGVHTSHSNRHGIGRGAMLATKLANLLAYVPLIKDRLDHRHIPLPVGFDFEKIASFRKYHDVPVLAAESAPEEVQETKANASADYLEELVRGARESISAGAFIRRESWRRAGGMIDNITVLCDSLERFYMVLRVDAAKSRQRRQSLHPAHDFNSRGTAVEHSSSSKQVGKYVSVVHSKLKDSEPYMEILIDDEFMLAGLIAGGFTTRPLAKSLRKTRRRDFKKQLCTFPYPVTVLTYSIGGGKQDLVWIWRRPHAQHEDATENTRVSIRIGLQLPVYSSRNREATDRTFLRGLGLTSAGAAEYVRREMLGECNMPIDSGRRELHERVVQYVAAGYDPAMIADLRHLNSSERGFEEFFDLANTVVAKMNTAVHERRHSTDASTSGNMVEYVSHCQCTAHTATLCS